MAHIFRLLHGRHGVEQFFLEDTVSGIGVDGEIAHAEGGEVLKEVRTLRGVDVIVLQSRLHDDAGGRDVGPLHRDTEPGIGGAPAPWSHEHVVLVCVEELLVDALDMIGDGRIVGGGEVLVSLHIDHILHILRDAVSEGVIGAQQTSVVGNLLEVFVKHLLGVDDRTDLQQIQLPSHALPVVRVEIAGKLYLHRATHLL